MKKLFSGFYFLVLFCSSYSGAAYGSCPKLAGTYTCASGQDVYEITFAPSLDQNKSNFGFTIIDPKLNSSMFELKISRKTLKAKYDRARCVVYRREEDRDDYPVEEVLELTQQGIVYVQEAGQTYFMRHQRIFNSDGRVIPTAYFCAPKNAKSSEKAIVDIEMKQDDSQFGQPGPLSNVL